MNILKSKQEQLTLGFGQTKLNGAPYNHTGIDYVKNYNQLDLIIAGARGKVVAIQKGITGYLAGSYGNYVKLQHSDGYETLYCHMKYGSVLLNVGDVVECGQDIGYMGATGFVTGAHVHFEVRLNGVCVDPMPYIRGDKTIPGYVKNVDIEALAREVIAGKYGNGEQRKQALGANYSAVQARVNEILLGSSQPVKKSIDEIAREVIKGLWGNGADRKVKLTNAGYDYNVVQARVNQLI